MFGIAVFTALGTIAVGTAVAPTRLTLAGTIATQTPIPGGASAEPVVPEQAAAPAVIPDAAAALPGGAPPIARLTGYRWPLPHARITLPFGPTPWGEWIVGGRSVHDGVDLATFCGDKIVAAHDGTVLAAGRHFDDTLGWIGDLGAYYARLDAKKLWTTLPIVVVIDDGNGYRSIYAHFGKITVKTGQAVKAGDLLGYEGRTGHASGCHLHYGLFSPFETASFAIDPAIMARMKVPSEEIARVDPLRVLPPRPKPSPKPKPVAASPTP
jgi:murein DD-endopeptidase MepM/ murein hydrolase activator NlpD